MYINVCINCECLECTENRGKIMYILIKEKNTKEPEEPKKNRKGHKKIIKKAKKAPKKRA